MENSVGKFGDGVETSKKAARSLDVQSLYKSKVLKEGGHNEGKKKTTGRGGDYDEVGKKKRKSRKEVGVSSLEPAGKKSRRNSLVEVVVEGSGQSEDGSCELGLGQRVNGGSSSGGLNDISLNLDNNGKVIRIPKRPRGCVGRNKFGSNHVLKLSGSSSSIDQRSKLNGELKTSECNDVSKTTEPSDCKIRSIDQSVKLNSSSSGKVDDPKLNPKTEFDDCEELGTGTSTSARHVNKEGGQQVVNNGHVSSSKKGRNSHRKRKNSVSASETVPKKVEPSVDNSARKRASGGGTVAKKIGPSVDSSVSGKRAPGNGTVAKKVDPSADNLVSRKRATGSGTFLMKVERPVDNSLSKKSSSGSGTLEKFEPSVNNSIGTCDDFQDDDEENLEQNAARMLSSRFDPSCKLSATSPSADGFSFLISRGRDFSDRGAKSVGGFESASADSASRVLRPRQHYRDKGLSRKRRHFYEIHSRYLDAYWFLNRRIKVFWPLDESWYFGLVKEYDPERQLHHIKYDDRDEEWIDLQSERFKLLLLPGEVPDMEEPIESFAGDKHIDVGKRDLTMHEDSHIGSHMDTEPIISWLPRSSLRVKSSPSCAGAPKKPKLTHLSPDFVPPPLPEKTEYGCRDGDKRPACDSDLPDRLTHSRRGQEPVLENSTSSKESKLPVVYVRRRWLQKNNEESCLPPTNKQTCASGFISSYFPAVNIFQASNECNSLVCFDSDEFWLKDNVVKSNLSVAFTESTKFRLDLRLPLRPLLEYPCGVEIAKLLRTILLLQHGSIVSTWPKVHLEVLLVDDMVGLRFFLFEGCLKDAVAFVFLVLTVFDGPNKQASDAYMQMPVTSIRFELSCFEDLRKQHTFAYYSFSKVNYSSWLYLDYKLGQHCSLTKQLPLPECTYDNIKALEGGSKRLHASSVGWKPSFQGTRKNSVLGILPIGVSKGFCNANRSDSSSFGAKHGRLQPFALTFTTAPTFFLSLHLKMLMERRVACITLHDHDSLHSLEHPGNTCQLSDENGSQNTSESTIGTSLTDACPELLSCAKPVLGTEAFPSQQLQNDESNLVVTSKCFKDLKNPVPDVRVHLRKRVSEDLEPEHDVVSKDNTSSAMSNPRYHSSLNGMSVQIPQIDEVGSPVDGKIPSSSQLGSDSAWNMNDGIVFSPNPTGPRSLWLRNRNGSNSSSLLDYSHLWSDGKTNFISNGFGNGPKKPRTRVQYTVPFGDYDFSSRHKTHNQNGLPFKRIRRANEKMISDGTKTKQRNLELLACDANVLINLGDRGCRECGARIVLEPADHNEWKLAVKLCGITKYSYKVNQILQPGSTNRYTHAMMWKGGKDWALEFPDRSQWILFKEMYEECHNRNSRAALVKNIPIPGVRLIEESREYAADVPFVRSSPMYFCQVESDVEMAMDPTRIFYDVDSDDDRWILRNGKTLQSDGNVEISEKLFEKTMDAFEKVAYAQQRDHFTADEIEEFMDGGGPMEAIKLIHGYWRQKRQRKGMPLIRQLQPPLWERYQQQVKVGEHSLIKANTTGSSGSPDKAPPIEKPPMFAFCMKPRGLELLNKGSKHRSHRRFSVSGHSHAVFGDHDGLHAFGRRLNGYMYGDDKDILPSNGNEYSDASPLLRASMRVYSPRDVGGPAYFSLSSDTSELNHHPKLHRNKSKKIGALLSTCNPQMVSLGNQKTIGKRIGVNRWNMGLPEWPSQKHLPLDGPYGHGIEELGGPELDEFRLRDASSAAQHALNMARLKREKAQKLLYKADLAVHKAMAALMTADAVKASYEDSNGDG